MPTAEATQTWTDICAASDLFPGNPVGAVIGDQHIAIIRYDLERYYAVALFDPFSKAMVMSRGIVGCIKAEPMLASPIYKQRFALETGVCFDDPSVTLRTYPLRILAGRIQVAA